MALDIKVIEEKAEDLEFEFQGEPVKGTCYPFKVTPAYMRSLRKLAAKAEPSGESKPEGDEAEEVVSSGDARMVSELIPDWDVLAGGQPWPTTPVNIANTPSALLGAAALAILDLVGKLSQPSESKS